MKNNTRFFTPLLYAILIIVGMFIGAKLTPVNRMFSGSQSASIYNYNKIQDILYLIERDYVDTVDKGMLVDMAISGMLQRLDPHSVYITTEELKSVNEELEGNFEGIGVQFSIRRDTVMVVQVIRGGPSEKGGVLAGDRIVNVDGVRIAGTGISDLEVMKKLKGPKGSPVKVELFRPGTGKTMTLNLVRDVIRTVSIDAAYMLNSSAGYIRMHTFAGNTYAEFMTSMKNLEREGMTQLILDLRGNGGGLLDQAVKIANEFFGSRQLIVYTMGKSGKKKMFYADGNGKYASVSLVVLLDDFSASASEIIAGAVQDNDRGWIIGRRSFGKGLVQQQVELADGSAIRITTERYYTPSGRSIQKPYSPDQQDDYYLELLHRYDNGETESGENKNQPDSLKFQTLKKRRTVYGGGGITPDFYIPPQHLHESDWFKKLSNSGLIFEFASDYVDLNRQEITAKYDSMTFVTRYMPGTVVVKKFIDYASKQGISPDKKSMDSEENIRFMLKAYMARNLYGEEAFFRVLNSRDESVKKAISQIKKKL